MENFGVYDEETVMRLLVFMDGYCRIFSIVSLQVQLQLFGEFGCIYSSFHFFISLTKYHKGIFINIIVNENNCLLGWFYQIRGENIGIEDLSFKKDTFYGWKGGTDKEIYFFFYLPDTLFVFR